MTPTEAPARANARRSDPGRADDPTDERGFALIWFALVLVVLVGISGAGVDVWAWWHSANQQQRTADAAALAGVVFLPDDVTSARATALELAVANGEDPADVVIETFMDDPALAPNEMRVSVNRDVGTRFLGLLGVGAADISRAATAEFTARLPMGSPEQFLGRDPERGFDPGYWLSVSGRGESKIGGDRYQNITCGNASVYNCDSGSSIEYSPEGYAFSVQMSAPPTGDLVIEAYDPVHTETGSQDCTNNGYLNQATYDANKLAIFAQTGDVLADARYAAGDTVYCQGDVGGGRNPNAATRNVTTFIVRNPDVTPTNDFDNPAYSGASTVDVATSLGTGVVDVTSADSIDPTASLAAMPCTKQFRAILDPGTRSVYSLLNLADFPLDLNDIKEGVYAQATYRQWVNVCTIPQATAQSWWDAGTTSVIVQVRSNADLGTPFTASTAGRRGRNHFALRAGYGTATAASNVQIYAQGRLPIHNGAAGASTTEFFLTRVNAGNAGRTLSLEFFDVADASQPATFEIVPPFGYVVGGFPGTFDDCTFTRFTGNNNGTNTGQNMAADASGCTLSNVSNALYNGRVTDVRLVLPADYTCDNTNLADCWVKVRVTYAAGGTVYDHTVWDAGIVGDPVRLIE